MGKDERGHFVRNRVVCCVSVLAFATLTVFDMYVTEDVSSLLVGELMFNCHFSWKI